MSMILLGGNQRRTEQIARDLVARLSLMDLVHIVGEDIGFDGEQRLCAAVDDDFQKGERRIEQLNKLINAALPTKVEKLVEERDELLLRASVARQKAEFLLGFATAQRLLGVDQPKAKRRTS